MCPICDLHDSPSPTCLCGYEHTTGDTTQVVARAVEARRSGARAMLRAGVAIVAAIPLVMVIPVVPIAGLLWLFGGASAVRGWRRYREAGRRMRRMLPMARVVDR